MKKRTTFVLGYQARRPDNWYELSVDERRALPLKVKCVHRQGFWKEESIRNLARKLGYVDSVDVMYSEY